MNNLLYRIKTKPGYKFVGIILLLVGIYYALQATDPVHQLKENPNEQLVCQFTDGVRVVPKDKIVAYIGEEDAWAFTNGSASNCWIEKN